MIILLYAVGKPQTTGPTDRRKNVKQKRCRLFDLQALLLCVRFHIRHTPTLRRNRKVSLLLGLADQLCFEYQRDGYVLA
jgi:hypothetical protein